MITKREKKLGRPKGSKGIKTSKEIALWVILEELFRREVNKFWSVYKPSILFDEIDFSNEKESSIFTHGLIFGAKLVQQDVFPKFIKPHLKNIKLARYVEDMAIQEKFVKVIKVKQPIPIFIPQNNRRKARQKINEMFREYSKSDSSKVLDKENNLKTFKDISQHTKFPLEKVDKIIRDAKKGKKDINLVKRYGEDVLVLDRLYYSNR